MKAGGETAQSIELAQPGKRARGPKGRFLMQVLLLISVTILLNAVLTSVVFTFTSRNLFANQKAQEMLPRVSAISKWTALYQQGAISGQEYQRIVADDGSLWDAMLHIYDAQGGLIAVTNTTESAELSKLLTCYVADLTEKKTSLVMTLAQDIGIVVGLPVTGLDGEITGSVFLTKPLRELNTASSGMVMALFVSLLLVFVVLLLPAYFVSRGITKPLSQMSLAARAMAAGNFSVRADERRKDEIGQLGRSLNDLSAALSSTIGDLMIERNRLRDVLNGLTEGVIAIDQEGGISHYNSSAIRLLGGEQGASLAGLPLFAALLPALATASKEGTTCSRTLEAGEATLAVTITQLQDSRERSAGALAMIQDITQSARLEQTRRDYVANVSHELRTPIASIRSLADALNDGMVKAESDRVRYYGYILRESMRLSRLINDLLELSRLQSGGVALEKRNMDVTRLFQELTERFEEVAEDSGLSFRLALPDTELHAYSNDDRVEQVLIALLDNAIKYAADGGVVTLEARVDAAHLVISVRNTGEIAQDDLPHLFERFYKADKSHTGNGTGLGLAIAHEIMVQLGERIWVKNREGEAVFSFTLRSVQEPDEMNPAAS